MKAMTFGHFYFISMRRNSLEKKNKEEKMNLIMNVAEKIFVEKGYEEATMTEIAKRANLAKGTLYLYFSSKKDLYFTSVERALSTLLASTNLQVSLNMGHLIHTLFEDLRSKQNHQKLLRSSIT